MFDKHVDYHNLLAHEAIAIVAVAVFSLLNGVMFGINALNGVSL